MQPNINVNQNYKPQENSIQPMHQQQPMQPTPKSSKLPWIILVIVILVVLAALAYLFRDKFTTTNGPKLSGYQAIFLTNGQVYFGKLSDAGDKYAELRDIYYLQVNQPLQTGQNAQNQQSQSQQQPQLSLVKLGNELHGPADLMFINRDQILFYEDLKADGKVAQAIQSYQQKGSQQSSADQSQQSAPQSSQQPAQQPAQQQQQSPMIPATTGK